MRCRAIKKNGKQCRQCGKPQQSGGEIINGYCNYHKQFRDEDTKKTEDTKETPNSEIPLEIKLYLSKPFDKYEYYRLISKYHPDKNKSYSVSLITLFSQLINSHKI